MPRREAQGQGPRMTPLAAPPLQDSSRTLGAASWRRPRGDQHAPGRAPEAQVSPRSAQTSGFTLAAGYRPPALMSLVPPRALPTRLPSLFPFPCAFSGQAPTSLTSSPPAPANFSAVPSPNPRTGFLNPTRPAAPSRRVTVAFTDQPPFEPRRQRGGAGARWSGVWWGRGGIEERREL